MKHASLFACTLLLWPKAASAHSPVEGIGSFYAGFLHPLLVPAHLLALLALGCWLAQQSQAARRQAVVVFALALAVALPIGDTPLSEPLRGLAPLLVALLAGALAACRVVPAQPITPLVAALAAVAIAIDSLPVDDGAAAFRFHVGVWLGACVLTLNLAAHGGRLTRRWQRLGLRVAGAWVAAAAIMVTALAFATQA